MSVAPQQRVMLMHILKVWSWVNWLQEVKEGTAKVVAAVDNSHIDLQVPRVSHLTTLKRTATLLLLELSHKHILMMRGHLPRLPTTESGMRTIRELRCGINLEPLPLNLQWLKKLSQCLAILER